jgi:hypothetical protein
MADRGSGGVKAEAVRIVPQILWLLAALYVFNQLYKPVLSYIEKGEISESSVLSVQLKLAQASLAQANAKAGAIKTPQAFAPLEERIRRLAPKMAGASVLWVDDNHPIDNLFERHALSALGLGVDMVADTEEALKMLSLSKYDVVVSDLDRPGQSDNGTSCGNANQGAGCGLLKSIHARFGVQQPPSIIYAASYDEGSGAPPYAFAVTDRTDYLFQYILDALDRRNIGP